MKIFICYIFRDPERNSLSTLMRSRLSSMPPLRPSSPHLQTSPLPPPVSLSVINHSKARLLILPFWNIRNISRHYLLCLPIGQKRGGEEIQNNEKRNQTNRPINHSPARPQKIQIQKKIQNKYKKIKKMMKREISRVDGQSTPPPWRHPPAHIVICLHQYSVISLHQSSSVYISHLFTSVFSHQSLVYVFSNIQSDFKECETKMIKNIIKFQNLVEKGRGMILKISEGLNQIMYILWFRFRFIRQSKSREKATSIRNYIRIYIKTPNFVNRKVWKLYIYFSLKKELIFIDTLQKGIFNISC